jgi:hypothetical protein
MSGCTFDRLEKTMLNLLKTEVVMVLLVALAAGQSSSSAEKRASSLPSKLSQPGKSASSSASAPDASTKSSDFEKNLSQSVIDNTTDPDDHVRCFFTVKQLMDLQPIPGVAKLTEADESRVLTGLVTAVRDANEKDLSRSQKAQFIARLTEDPDKLDGKLIGKTPGEALATIMDALYKITSASKDEIAGAAITSAEANGGADFAKHVRKKLYDPNTSWYRAGDAAATSDRLAALVGQVPDELAAEEAQAASQTAADLRNRSAAVVGAADSRDKVEQAAMEIAKLNGGDAFSREVEERLKATNSNWYKPKDPKGTLSGAASVVERIPQEKGASKDYSTVVSKVTNDASSDGQTDLSSVVDKARSDLNKLARPEDIGCAYQILSWNDARLWFGRSVANEFVAVQITVRNMNKQEEFILHNAMLSVRTDINGALGQYYEGVDKLGVEAHNNAGESLTARGIVGNSISAATTLLSALQPIVNVGNFSNAVAAFNGGVPKGWAALEPDHQKDQLLMIANSGFSASDGFKTVVPKSSTATFYTWFPAKPFLEGWWTQKCARDVAGVNPNRSSTSPQVGVDSEWARDLCKNTPASTWETIPYKKWSSISDQLFRDLSLAVIAGMHVREDSKNKASITDLKCPKDSQGRLDLSKASSNGTLSCDVSGENMDKVTKLRLENAGNLVDPARPDGVISEVSSDNTGAKVAFNTSDLNAAPGDSYNVFSVGKDGTENATGQKVYLKHDAPKLTKVDPSSLDLGKKPPDNLSLTGTNLDTLKNVCLKGPSSETKTVKVSDAKSTQATVDVSSAGLTQGDWQIYVEECPVASASKEFLLLKVTAAKAQAGKAR